jgi:3-methyladenine DNA glycosylase/8-oxoguanine DNA glycosylase
MAVRSRKLPYDVEAARRHLQRSDPVLRGIIRAAGALELDQRGTPYQSLFRALLYQQLAGPAAAAIERRLLGLSGGRVPEPHELLALTAEDLRAVGISRQKAGYLHSLAEHASNAGLERRKLARMSDDDAIAAVTEIRGVGRWTADMLLIFCLGRPDVLPVGDLGIQKAIMRAYRLTSLPDAATMTEIGEPWRPYRSAATWYLWRSVDTVEF